MNVAILHYSVPPIVGGVESVIAHQARLMAGHGHAVRLIAGRGQAMGKRIPLFQIPLADSRHERVARLKKQLDGGRVPAEFVVLRDKLAIELQKALSGASLILAHNVCSLHKNLALTAALFELHQSGRLPRLILWHHDLAWLTARYRPELHEGYPWDLLRKDWGGPLQVTISEPRRAELAGLMNLDPASISVIPNGVDLSRFYKLEARTKTLIKKMALLEAAPILLLPVRLTPRKNVELALEMLAHLRRYLPRAALVITGPLGAHNADNRKYFDALLDLRRRLQLEGSAHFLAELRGTLLPDAVIADFYRLADVLFLPSREEGFGLPVLEAGLAGLPIFCSDIPALRVLGSKYATYFPPDMPAEDLAELVAARLSSNPRYCLRAEFRQRYTWERIYAEMIAPLLN